MNAWAWLFSIFRWRTVMAGLVADIILKAGVSLVGVHPDLIARLNAAQASLRARGIQLRITSGRDGRHRPGSSHYRGAAVDVTPADRAKGWDPAYRAIMVQALQSAGLRVTDEYANPSRLSTGGHLHVSHPGV